MGIRKKICLFILFAFSFNVINVTALSKEETGRILDRFTNRQYDLIFESDLINFSAEYQNVFSVSKQLDEFSSMYIDIEKEKEEIINKREELLDTISSLKDSIAQIDGDIQETSKKVNQINSDVIKIKAEIDVNTKTIENLRAKVEENTEILLDYIVYTYKKANISYSWDKVDNLKSILLNGEPIGELINDLYFKWIIQVAWKKLIDNHRKFMAELYLQRVSLEKQEKDLKELRKQWIIEQKILQDKKIYKEEILEASKWEQSLYEQYLNDKLLEENKLKLQTIKEQVRVNVTRDKILKKYNCEYVDVSKNTSEARLLAIKSPKCYSINKIIVSENMLVNTDNNVSSINPMNWPVNPIRWITAYYRDKEYEQAFGAQHNAVDIKVAQWTMIEAPMDGYVMYMNKPTSQDYSYLALKHADWYVTVYGHLSEILVEEFQYVEAWEVIAKSWWEYGTYWAWYMTTGAHLHFEVFKNQEYIDPLSVLDLTAIKYQRLPEKYELKYAMDFKNKNWYDYEDLSSNTKVFKLEWKDEIERQKYLISRYAAAWFNDWQIWVNEALDWSVDPSFVMCIWLAESWLGKSLTTAYNIWNVWNNDRWDRKDFKNAREGISAIVYTLNNKYFQNYDNMWYLSWGWRVELWLPGCWATPTEYCYASSMNHWHNNIKRCLTHLKWVYIDDNYNFRLK